MELVIFNTSSDLHWLSALLGSPGGLVPIVVPAISSASGVLISWKLNSFGMCYFYMKLKLNNEE